MRLLLLTVLVLVSTASIAQLAGDYRSDQNGNWNVATTWEVFISGAWEKLESTNAGPFQNITPSSVSGAINIQNNVTVTASVSVDELALTAGNLIISASQILTILDGPGNDFVNSSSGASSITTTGTLTFAADAVYEHARNGGTIPLATWGANSTCLVTGLTNSNPTIVAGNAFENFVWDCPGQSGLRTLNGNLTTVNKDLLINDTNNQILRLTAGAVFTLDVAGDFTVVNNSRIQFCTTASGVIINVLGNFDFSPDLATTASTLKTSGSYNLNVTGDFSQNSGTLNLSGGGGVGAVNIVGDFLQSAGVISETGAGSGVINFNGSAGMQSIEQNGTISNIVAVTVQNSFGVALNSNATLPSDLSQLSGAGNIDINGFILTVNGNLSQASGAIASNSTSELILQGSGTLPVLPIAFAGTDMNRLRLNQNGTLQTSSSIAINNLDLYSGTLTSNTVSISTGGIVERRAGIITNTPLGSSYDLIYNISSATNTGSEMPSSATVLNNLTKLGNATLTLNQALVTVNGDLTLTTGTFALGANSLTLGGNFISNSALTAATGSAFTIPVAASCSLSGSVAPAFNDLFVNGTFTPAVGATGYRVDGNFVVANGATVNAGSGTVTFGGTTAVSNNGTMNLNTVVISGGATLTAPITTMGIAGNFTSTGTFNNGGGTILFNGVTNLAGVEVYNNVTVTGTVTSTGNSSQTIGGNLINNGSFSLGTGNLTWSGSGTISGSGNTTVADVNVTGTSCTYLATGTLTLNDDLLGTGTFDSSSPTAGTVVFAGAGSAISNAGTKTLRNISVTGTLTPGTTYTLAGAGGLDVTGTLNSGGTIVFGGTTQTITGSSSSIAFNVFTTNPGSDLTITPSITINGNLTGDGNITAAGTITFVGLTMSGVGIKNFNNVTVGTGTLTPNANYSIAGNLIVNGTLASGNATTTFNGTTTISGAGASNFNSLTITGTLTSSSGTISIDRDLTNSGVFNHNNGTVSFSTVNNAGSQNIAGSQSIVFNNLTVNNIGIATDLINNITSPATVSLLGTLLFGETNSVFDADGAGTSQFILVSTNDSPATDARIAIIPNNSNITGTYTVQRFVSNEGSGRFYRYIASPLVGSTVADLQAAIPVTGTFTDPSVCSGCISTSPSLFSYNEATNAYVAFPATGLASANPFVNGRGYSAFFRHTGSGGVGNTTINFIGTSPATGNITLPVSPNTNGYSLIGNPYASAIRWDNGAGWTKNNIADGVVVRDNSTGIHQSYSAGTGNGVIAAGQSFWVQSSAVGASLTINQNAKSASATDFYRIGETIADQLEIQLTKGTTGTTDAARIEIRANSTASVDSYDVVRFNNNMDDGSTITEVQDVAVMNATTALMVSAIPSITCSETFNLRVNDILNAGETTATYNLSLNPGGSFAALGWILMDAAQPGQEISMPPGASYEFTVNVTDPTVLVIPGTNPVRYRTNRFSIKASPISINTALQISSQNSLCNGSEAVITIANSQSGVVYGVEINGQLNPGGEQGNGQNLNIFIPSELLSSGTNSIRIRANAGCDAQFLNTASAINKVEVFSITQTTGSTLCKPGIATINAVASSGNATYRWYTNESSTQVLSTDPQWTTPELNATTTYYVAAVNESGCESLRVPVTVEYNDITAIIEVESATNQVCAGQTMTLIAKSAMSNGVYRWYESSSGATPLSEGDSFTTPSLPKTTKYYVSLTSPSGCEGARVEVYATVASYNPQLSAVPEMEEICAGNSHNFIAQGAPEGSTYAWFDSNESLTSFQEGLVFNTPKLTSSKTYYLEARNEFGCVSSRFAIDAKVSQAPSVDVSIPALTVCPGTESELTLNPGDGSNVTYSWYESVNTTSQIHQGLTWTTPPLESTTSYYVSALNSFGCESKDRKQVNVNVVSIQEPFIESPGAGLLRTSVSVGDIQWYFNDEILEGETERELIIGDQVGAYSLTVNHNGCQTSSSRYADQNIVTSLEMKATTYFVYPNPANEKIMIEVVEQNPVKAQLIDGRGALIDSINLHQFEDKWKGEINVTDVSAGSYFIRLTSGKKSITHQVIIRK